MTLQLALFFVATAYLAIGIFLAPMIAGILADGLLAPLMTIPESLTRSRG